MDKPESGGDDHERKGSKKRVAMSTDVERPSKTARTGASNDTRRLEDVPATRHRVEEDKEAEVDHLVKAQDVEKGAVVRIVWENPFVMAYVKLEDKYVDAKRPAALLSHGQASKIVFAERSRATVYGVWRLRQEEWGTANEYTEE